MIIVYCKVGLLAICVWPKRTCCSFPNEINVQLCLMLVLFELHPFMPRFVTLTTSTTIICAE